MNFEPKKDKINVKLFDLQYKWNDEWKTWIMAIMATKQEKQFVNMFSMTIMYSMTYKNKIWMKSVLFFYLFCLVIILTEYVV